MIDHIRNMLNEKKLQEQLDYLEKITYFENALVKKNKNTYAKNESRNRFSDIVPGTLVTESLFIFA